MAECGIKDKTFLITGGASGLGAVYAETVLREGAKKVIILDINEELGAVTTKHLHKEYVNKAIFIKCDMSKEEDIVQAFDKASSDGKIDVIINNAGIMNDSPEVWRKMCDVNYLGVVSLTLKGIQHMRLDNSGSGGTIINVSSALGLVKARPLPIYCGTKMGVLHCSQSIAMPPGHSGVRIMTICLNATNTLLLHNLKAKSYEQHTGYELEEMARQALFQRPESAAAAVVKMLHEGANGSVWLSQNNEDGKDITDIIENVYNILDKIAM